MPNVFGKDYSKRDLHWTSDWWARQNNTDVETGRQKAIEQYNHYKATGQYTDPTFQRWAGYNNNPPTTQDLFGPEFDDGYWGKPLPETEPEFPPQTGKPSKDYSNSRFGKIETTTVMGWEYLQDLAQLWAGTKLIENNTFPQQSNWPTFVIDEKSQQGVERSTVTSILSLDTSNPVKPKGELEIFMEDDIKDIEFGNRSIPNDAMTRQYLSLSGYRSDSGIPQLPRPSSYSYDFKTQLKNWMIKQPSFVNIDLQREIQFPEARGLNSAHWHLTKYNKNNTFAFFATLPNSLDPFIIKENETSPYCVCSIPDFLDYEIPGTKRPFRDVIDTAKSLRVDQQIKFNAVILYADNDGTPALICATKIDPPIESRGIAPNFFQYRYYSQSIETSNVKIEEL